MGKFLDQNVAAEKEFASLALVLVHTADDAAQCLKALKQNLSEYDTRHGNLFLSSAKSYMRSDIRYAKDIATDLRHVAHRINKSHHPSQSKVTLARNTMNATANALKILTTKGLNYDETNGRATGIKGALQNVVGGAHEKIKSSTSLHLEVVSDRNGGYLRPDTVEALVESTLRDNFNLKVLSYQINAAEKSLMTSLNEQPKEAMHMRKEKYTLDMPSQALAIYPMHSAIS